MPWIIAKKNEEWCVYKKGSDGKPTGKTKGCHPSKKKAEAQMAALHANVLESVELAHEDIHDRLRVALETRYAVDPSTMEGIWIKRTYPDKVVFEYMGKLWELPYTLDEQGVVILDAGEKEVLPSYIPVEEHVGMHTIAAIARPFSILESEGDEKILRFQGCVLVDEVLSQGGKGRYYSKEFNDRCMEATNLFMSAGGIVTVYSRHAKVAGETGTALYASGLPVGRVTKPLWRKGAEIFYEAMISPTAEGNDVMVLIRDRVLQDTSLRASKYSSRMRALEDATVVEEMVSAVIVGIDLCEQGGIEGAGIRRVLEEAPQWKVIEEDNLMDFTELTLEELVEHRQDLLDAHTTPLLEAKDGAIATLADANATLKTQLAAAAAPSPDVGRLAILEASNCGLSKIMADKLTAMGVGTIEAIAPVLESVRAASLQELVADATPAAVVVPGAPVVLESALGKSNLPNMDPSGAPPADPAITPEQARILELSQGRRNRRS